MGGEAQWRKKLVAGNAAVPLTDETARRQLAVSVGTESFAHRDPIYHLQESFCSSFDMMGQQRAMGQSPSLDKALSSYMTEDVPGLTGFGDGEKEDSKEDNKERQKDGGGRLSREFLNKTSMDPYFQQRGREPGDRMLNRFSEIAFNRGAMASAVLRGQGKMMLFSCLKRTVNQNQPKQLQERKLFQSRSSFRMVKGGRGDIAVTNRGFANSAVGVVTDVLKDSRQVLETLTKLAEGVGTPDGKAGTDTMAKMYPFLTDSDERALLEQYRQRQLLPGLSVEERETVSRAIVRTEAVIAKKDQMKRDFLGKLRYISFCAASAARIFSQDEFSQELNSWLQDEKTPELPPPDGGDGNGKGKGKPDADTDKAKGGDGRTE